MLTIFSGREHQEILELAIMQTVEPIPDAESGRVEDHLAGCESCRAAIEEYRLLLDYGRAIPKRAELELPEALWNQDKQKARLLARFHSQRKQESQTHVGTDRSRLGRLSIVTGYAAAAAALVATGLFLGYELGSHTVRSTNAVLVAPPNIPQPSAASPASKTTDAFRQELEQAREQSAVSDRRVTEVESRLTRLQTSLAAMQTRNQSLDNELTANSSNLQAATKEKDEVAAKLTQAQQELQDVRDQRSRDLLRVATAEFKLDQVKDQLREKDDAIARQQQYLESDRDVRELMGARQLHIADVTDVDRNGQTRKSFGRVFYTKGKSLIFYAFDLDQQPGVHNASVFQAWGHSDGQASHPVSLGFFYLDSESNRRWVVKTDNSQVLSQLDAVFVTVERDVKGKQPSGKPFLYTYLRKGEPNHP